MVQWLPFLCTKESLIFLVMIFYIQKNATKWRDIAIYNPTSILHFLNSGELENYWIKTGPSNFVVTNAQKSLELGFDIHAMPIHVSEGYTG